MNHTIKMVAAAAVAAVLAVATVYGEDTEKVRGKGTGADRVEALKDAYRDAIERVVGMYVDAEQMVKNEELVNDQILTQSNAYIEKYEIVKETAKPNGLVEILILADVRKSALTKKMSDVMPAKTFRLDSSVTQNLHAKLVTEEKRTEDGAALVKKALAGVDPVRSLVTATLASPEPTIVDTNGGDRQNFVTLRYAFKFELDRSRYMTEFLPNIRKTLEQVSVSAPKTMRLAIDQQYRDKNRGEIKMTSGAGSNNHINCIRYTGVLNGGKIDSPNAFRGFSSSLPKYALLVTDVGKDFNTAKVQVYELDKATGEELRAWAASVVFANPQVGINTRDLNFNVVVSGKDGSDICVAPMKVDFARLAPIYFNGARGGGYDSYVLIVPLLAGFAETCYQCVDCKIPKDELPNVANITIELAE